MRRKKKRLKKEKKNAACKSIWGNRPRNTNYKLIGPKIESVKMNSKRSKKNSGITGPSFSRLKLMSSVMTGNWKLDGLLSKSGRSKQKVDNLLPVNLDRSLSLLFEFLLKPLRFVLEPFTFTLWTVHFHSERTAHIHFLDSSLFLVLDRPLSPRTILIQMQNMMIIYILGE